MSGPDSGTFQHGRVSKHLPSHLIPMYEEFLSDSELLSMTQEIALIDTRKAELMQGLSNEDGILVWRRLKAYAMQYQRYRESRHESRAQEKLSQIFQLIESGASDYERWNSILELTEQRRKTAESERKRLVETNQMISTKEAMTMLSVFIDLAKKYIPSKEGLVGLSSDIDSIFNNRRGGSAQA